jgi:small basic protein
LVLGGLAIVAALDFTAGGIATTGLKTYDQGIGLAAVSIILSFFCQIAFAGVYLLVSECPNMILREYTIAYSIWVNLASTIISTVGFPYLLGPP